MASVVFGALATDRHAGGSHTLFLVIGLGVIVAVLVAIAINCLKGKYWTAAGIVLIGVIGFVCGIVGASRLAKPNSWWAHRFYDEHKLARAREAFEEAPRPA